MMEGQLHEFTPDISSFENGDYVQLAHRRVVDGEIIGISELRPLSDENPSYFFGSTAVQFSAGKAQPIEVYLGKDLELEEAYEVFLKRSDKAREQARASLKEIAAKQQPPTSQQRAQQSEDTGSQDESSGDDGGDIMDFDDLQ